MTQQEHLDYLVRELCRESEQYKDLNYSEHEKEQVLRSLMNVRMPRPVPRDFLEIQNAYLKEKAKEKGIVGLDKIRAISEEYGSIAPHADKLSIWQGDITRLGVDGIVNAANSQMLGCFVPCHGCIDNAIHSAAGIQLREECHRIMGVQGYSEPTGRAKVTAGYNLPAKYVIHTVGPIVSWKVTKELEADLVSCYQSCLNAAKENGIRSMAFCCISTGEFHYPNKEAALIAVNTVTQFLNDNSEVFERVIFNVFKDIDLDLYKEILGC